MMNRILLLIILIAASLLSPSVQAAWLTAIPQTIVQPNGDTVHCLASGDEFYNWLHDKDDYTIVKDPSTGYWVYATVVVDKMGASPHIVGRVDPITVGLQKGIKISNDEYLQRRAEWPESDELAGSPTTGTVNSIVVFIRFSDEPNFATPYSYFTGLFNSDTPGDPSVYNYWNEVSYEQLEMPSYFYPRTISNTTISFKDTLPRDYYRVYDSITNPDGYRGLSQRLVREHTLLRAAARYVDNQISDTLQLDRDNDGQVDMITFIIYGSPEGWNELLWPHRTSMTSFAYYINGDRLYSYAFMLESRFALGSGTMCHEMFHVLGAPDLYHYDSIWSFIEPVGRWGLMDEQGNPPHHMCAHMKEKYGHWINIPILTGGGLHILHDLTKDWNNAFRIRTAAAGGEEFVIEYRHDTPPFEFSIPDSGLLVFRINPSLWGNANGPPDEVYLYRPGGEWNINGDIDNAEFCANEGKVHINNLSDPWSFTSNGLPGGLFLADIGYNDTTMSFFFAPDYDEMTGGAVSGTWNSNLASTGYIYWITGNTYTTTGNSLTIANGSRIYGEAMTRLSSHGTITFAAGGSWTKIQSVEHFRAGISSRGTIKMYNGADIRFR